MAALGINGGYLLAQLLNFIIVVAALSLAWKPMVKALEGRRETIAKGLEDARAAEQARANAERDAQKYIDQKRAEANKLVEEARSRAEEQARTVLAGTNQQADAIRVRPRAEADDERNATLA